MINSLSLLQNYAKFLSRRKGSLGLLRVPPCDPFSLESCLVTFSKRDKTMNKSSTNKMGCEICRKANDSICNNFCLMDKSQKKKFIENNPHLFKNVKTLT